MMPAVSSQPFECLTGDNGDKGLAYDVWLPERPVKLVVHAHGGGFVHGSRHDRIAQYYGPFLAEHGIAFATIDYQRGGAPRRAFQPSMQKAIAHATERSLAAFPSVRADLLGPALYRATMNYADAVWAIKRQHGLLTELPWIALGNSSGALAAMGAVFGLQDLDLSEPVCAPEKVVGIAAIAPQPWMLTNDSPPLALLTARGDQVFKRAEVNRFEEIATVKALKVEIKRIPYGQHPRPVREIIPDGEGRWGGYAAWIWQQLGLTQHEGQAP